MEVQACSNQAWNPRDLALSTLSVASISNRREEGSHAGQWIPRQRQPLGCHDNHGVMATGSGRSAHTAWRLALWLILYHQLTVAPTNASSSSEFTGSHFHQAIHSYCWLNGTFLTNGTKLFQKIMYQMTILSMVEKIVYSLLSHSIQQCPLNRFFPRFRVIPDYCSGRLWPVTGSTNSNIPSMSASQRSVTAIQMIFVLMLWLFRGRESPSPPQYLHSSYQWSFSRGWTTWVISAVWIISLCQVFLVVISFQFNLWIIHIQSCGSRAVSKPDNCWSLLATVLLQFHDAVVPWIRGRGLKSVVVLHWHTRDVFKERHAAPAPWVRISASLRPALNCTRATASQGHRCPGVRPSEQLQRWDPRSQTFRAALGLPLQEQGCWKGNCWAWSSVPLFASFFRK